MSKWLVIVKWICHVSVSHVVQQVNLVLLCKLTPLLCSFKLFLSFSIQMTHQLTGTLIRCLPHACACSLTHVEALLFASGAVRGVGGMCPYKRRYTNTRRKMQMQLQMQLSLHIYVQMQITITTSDVSQMHLHLRHIRQLLNKV